jgi:hypothetical protein
MARLPVTVDPSPPRETGTPTYVLEGTVAQAADGTGPVRRPDTERPACAVTVWHCSTGQVNGVDVSGLTIVAVGRRDPDVAQRILFLDEDADPEQVGAILDLGWGRLGIAWAGLISVTDFGGAYQVPIQFDEPVVSVHDRLYLSLAAEIGEQWIEIPELELPWRSVEGRAATARFRVEG